MSTSFCNTPKKLNSLNKGEWLLQQGIITPLVVLFIAAFLVVPVGFFISSTNKSKDVKGADAENLALGSVVSIVSQENPWDLYQYLCKNKDECVKSLTSGKKSDSIHGGATSGSSVTISYKDSYKDYEYLKVYVKLGTDSNTTDYLVANSTSPEGAERITKVETKDVLLIPVTDLKDEKYNFFMFQAN